MQASLKAHKLKLKQRNSKKAPEQALYTKFVKKMKKGSSKNNKGKEKLEKKWNGIDDACKNSRSWGETSNNGGSHNQMFNAFVAKSLDTMLDIANLIKKQRKRQWCCTIF